MPKNAINWFEIPVNDLDRAAKFYEEMLGEPTIPFDLPELKMRMLPSEQGAVGGALCYHPDFYKPGQDGPLVYLNANPSIQKMLDRVESAGGKILQPRTQINEEIGYMAVILDSEGNRIALHATN